MRCVTGARADWTRADIEKILWFGRGIMVPARTVFRAGRDADAPPTSVSNGSVDGAGAVAFERRIRPAQPKWSTASAGKWPGRSWPLPERGHLVLQLLDLLLPRLLARHVHRAGDAHRLPRLGRGIAEVKPRCSRGEAEGKPRRSSRDAAATVQRRRASPAPPRPSCASRLRAAR